MNSRPERKKKMRKTRAPAHFFGARGFGAASARFLTKNAASRCHICFTLPCQHHRITENHILGLPRLAAATKRR
jgi:hypothetical protein